MLPIYRTYFEDDRSRQPDDAKHQPPQDSGHHSPALASRTMPRIAKAQASARKWLAVEQLESAPTSNTAARRNHESCPL